MTEPLKSKKFEDALKRLEEIVEKLESGDLPLDKSLSLFEEGTKLARFCTQKLNEAEKKVSMLVKNKEGDLKLKPFEIDKDLSDDTEDDK